MDSAVAGARIRARLGGAAIRIMRARPQGDAAEPRPGDA
jgi:hypothetical protein